MCSDLCRDVFILLFWILFLFSYASLFDLHNFDGHFAHDLFDLIFKIAHPCFAGIAIDDGAQALRREIALGWLLAPWLCGCAG